MYLKVVPPDIVVTLGSPIVAGYSFSDAINFRKMFFAIEEHLLVIHAAAKTLSYQRRATQRFEMKGVSQNTNQHIIRSMH